MSTSSIRLYTFNPTACKEREEMKGQDEEKKDREEGWELKFRFHVIHFALLDTLGIGWQLSVQEGLELRVSISWKAKSIDKLLDLLNV
ncbi:hypothetical protein Tco_0829830 [Tanacetum coccineum]